MGERPAGPTPTTHRVFGIHLRTDFVFDVPLPPGGPDVDLTFRCREGPPLDPPGGSGEPAFASPVRLESGAPFLAVHPGPREDLLRFSEVADFRVGDERIVCHLLDPEYAHVVEVHLLGAVMAYWFERRGVPMLHASAVVVDGTAGAFLASNKGGKSGLAATLVESGQPLLTDDLLGIEMEGGEALGRPGYPSMRFWPDLAARFVPAWEDLPLAHPSFSKRRLRVGEGAFGSFHDAPAPLASVYLPERRPAESGPAGIRIDPLPPGRALMELLRGAFLPRTVEAVGFAPRRLALLSAVAGRVPVKRLVYPEGYEHLHRVRDVIREDLARTGPLPAEGRP